MFKHDSTTRVLIVDDVADVRQDLRLLLEIAGDFQVVGEAEDGQEAVELAKSLRPDVVIMDLAMPVLDGYQAATRIRFDVAECRLVALTVQSTDASRQRAQAADFHAYVVKGAPLAELLEAVSPRCSQNPQTRGGLS
jgi:DNA-binding NarL/FixJ family response regulator